MNYYIITTEVFNAANKANISFRLFNLAGTNVLISTTDTISDAIEEFDNDVAVATYTSNNHADWNNAGVGVQLQEIDSIEYIPEIDD